MLYFLQVPTNSNTLEPSNDLSKYNYLNLVIIYAPSIFESLSFYTQLLKNYLSLLQDSGIQNYHGGSNDYSKYI